MIVDESHVSLPQFRGMYAGDRSRKEVLLSMDLDYHLLWIIDL